MPLLAAVPQELPSVAACSVRGYLAPTGFSFTEDITVAKPVSSTPPYS